MRYRNRYSSGRLVSELPVRVHDVTTGLAIGIALLKRIPRESQRGDSTDVTRALDVLEDSLVHLRKLTTTLAGSTRPLDRRRDLAKSLTDEALRLRISLDLELTGAETWLPPNHLQLVQLVGREALRNVRRHSGGSACRVTVDLGACPFVFRVRDWGGGLQAGASAGSGIALLQEMAADMGCDLAVGSQPGLGTELVLVGPPCARHRIVQAAEEKSPAIVASERAHKTEQDGEQSPDGGQLKLRVGRSIK